MKRLLVTLLMLLPSMAGATNWYIATTGAPGNTGKTSGSALRSIISISDSLKSGDTLFVLSENPSDTSNSYGGIGQCALVPSHNGSAANPIVVLGDTVNTTRLVLDVFMGNTRRGVSYFSIMGFRTRTISMDPAPSPSDTVPTGNIVRCCHMMMSSNTGLAMSFNSVNGLRLAKCTGRGTSSSGPFFKLWHATSTVRAFPTSCIIENTVFTAIVSPSIGISSGFLIDGGAHDCIVRNNHWTAFVGASVNSESQGFSFGKSRDNRYENNRFTATVTNFQASGTTPATFILRSSTDSSAIRSAFIADTIESSLDCGGILFPNVIQTVDLGPRSASHNRFQDCIFKGCETDIRFSTSMDNDTLVNNVFVNYSSVSTRHCVRLQAIDSSIVRHNTFMCFGAGSALNLGTAGTPGTGVNHVCSNVFATFSGPCVTGIGYTGVTLDSNLYYSYVDTAGDAIKISTVSYKVHTNFSDSEYLCANTPNWECNGVWADPRFPGNIQWETFNADMLPDGPRFSHSWPDLYVGADQVGTYLPDVIGPDPQTIGVVIAQGDLTDKTFSFVESGGDGNAYFADSVFICENLGAPITADTWRGAVIYADKARWPGDAAHPRTVQGDYGNDDAVPVCSGSCPFAWYAVVYKDYAGNIAFDGSNTVGYYYP